MIGRRNGEGVVGLPGPMALPGEGIGGQADSTPGAPGSLRPRVKKRPVHGKTGDPRLGDLHRLPLGDPFFGHHPHVAVRHDRAPVPVDDAAVTALDALFSLYKEVQLFNQFIDAADQKDPAMVQGRATDLEGVGEV